MSIEKIRSLFSRYIPLTQGKFAVVDAADYEWLMQWNWYASYDKKHRKWYAMRHIGGKKNSPVLLMHRAIMNAPSCKQVDHKDGDGLNNRRSSNLRLATNQQNSWNRGASANGSSGIKGVSWDKSRNKWLAHIRHNGIKRNLGRFDDMKDASLAYQQASSALHGEFARVS